MRISASRSFAVPLLGLLILALFAAMSPLASGEPDDWWQTDYTAALKEAKAKNLPVLIVFR